MTSRQIDLINIGLMIFSCLAAFFYPFELFLFSYAVLGPLHYLTQIAWLKKRDFFTHGKNDFLYLLGPCLGVSFVIILDHYQSAPLVKSLYAWCMAWTHGEFLSISNVMIYLGFFLAFASVFLKNTVHRILFFLFLLVTGIIFKDTNPFFFFFVIFLPTIVHVLIFTGLFIFQGALKSKSKVGFFSLLVFVCCAASFFVFFPPVESYMVDVSTQKTFIESGFTQLTVAFFKVFHLGDINGETVFASERGLAVMRLVAFAYTYHYLNWFSKTSIIRWHQVPRSWLVSVAVMWAASVALYAYDFRTGLMVLYFLSMAHVFLEFPLNFRSMVGIKEELMRKRVTKNKSKTDRK